MFNFDIAAAINSLAALERGIASITTSYGFEQNPGELADQALLPAICHLPMGPQNFTDSFVPGQHTTGLTFQLVYRLASRVLLAEVRPETELKSQHTQAPIWKDLADTLLKKQAMDQLAAGAGPSVHTAYTEFTEPSYAVRAWPPEPIQLRYYWSIEYIVNYVMIG